MKVVIVVEGGAVQYIISDGELNIITLDSDTDGCDEEYLARVAFCPGEGETYSVWMGGADQIDIGLVDNIYEQVKQGGRNFYENRPNAGILG